MNSALMQAADAGRIVLVPNIELQAALFEAIERAYRDRGREIWPTPLVRDFGGWLRERHLKRQLTDASSPRCMSDVEEREIWRRVVLEHDPGGEFLEPAGAARAARMARRAVYEHDIPLHDIEARGSEESLAFLAWNERFMERCRALDCIDAEQLLAFTGATPPMEPGDRPIAWIESPLWRPVARRWLWSNAGAPMPPSNVERARAGLQGARFLRARSAGAELASIAHWARRELQANADFRAWVCIADLAPRRSDVADAFDAELAPQRLSLRGAAEGVPYAIAGGTPLADHAPVRGALDLLSACGGPLSFEKFSVLLRAPELQASAIEASGAARLDALLRRFAPSEAPLDEWLTLADKVMQSHALAAAAALVRLRAASRSLDQLRGAHPMSRWLPVWIDAWEKGPWALRHRWSSGEFQAAERFRELLAALAIGDQTFGAQSRRSAENILRRAAHDTAFQAQTGVPAIWVTDKLTDPWLCYDGLWVTGCDEERWPPPLDPIPLLPIALQRQHGVIAASADAQLQFAEDLQGRWLERARSLTFSCADPEDGRRAMPSPLIIAAAADAPAPNQEPALEHHPQPHWSDLFSRAPALELLADEFAPPFAPHERTRGVSTLKGQSLCPFRGFAQTRLAAEMLERPLPGFNARERGELLHDALQRIWTELRDSSRLVSLPAAELHILVERSAREAIAKISRRRDPGTRWQERERQRLVPLLLKWLEVEALRAPFAIDRLEQGAAEAACHAGLDFAVRVDRIDRLLDGARVLIDYKTGAAYPDWRGERPDNPQLPLYALLHRRDLVAVGYGRVNAAECCFVVESERADIFRGKQATQLEGMKTFADLIDVWSVRIERLAQDFANGYAAVDPTPRACRSCNLHGLCRVPSTLDVSAMLADVSEKS